MFLVLWGNSHTVWLENAKISCVGIWWNFRMYVTVEDPRYMIHLLQPLVSYWIIVPYFSQ
jgi:hypothetical protein